LELSFFFFTFVKLFDTIPFLIQPQNELEFILNKVVLLVISSCELFDQMSLKHIAPVHRVKGVLVIQASFNNELAIHTSYSITLNGADYLFNLKRKLKSSGTTK